MLVKEVNVSSKIFESPNVKRKVDNVFEETQEKFRLRFEEIKKYIMELDKIFYDRDYSEVSYEDVLNGFKELIFENIANIAVEKTFSTSNHNLEENLIDTISTEFVEHEIMHDTMIEAFSNPIKKAEAKGVPWKIAMQGSMMKDLRCKFSKKQKNCSDEKNDKKKNRPIIPPPLRKWNT